VNELPQDKNTTILSFCKVSMRGNKAQRILESAGYTDVRVMEGGLMAWPYTSEQ
jgi:rhodanese-related sulfurtransferase